MNKTIQQLENKYGIYITDDSFFDIFSGKIRKQYKIFTADGCSWEKGLSWRSLLKERKTWGEEFIKIKNMNGYKGKTETA